MSDGALAMVLALGASALWAWVAHVVAGIWSTPRPGSDPSGDGGSADEGSRP